jgi:hypothetical protein
METHENARSKLNEDFLKESSAEGKHPALHEKDRRARNQLLLAAFLLPV